MNNVTKGKSGEQIAAAYLKRRFYKILEQNYRCRMGEIDIIAQKGSYIVFVEVKYRRDAEKGMPYEAVNYPKQQHIKNTAQYYLLQNSLQNCDCRFDVISILGNEVTHYKNAF
ncbi:MAG: YraN family protein [Firmicutes bacterium]|nr:YraN family protein [Bacillota bacterium]